MCSIHADFDPRVQHSLSRAEVPYGPPSLPATNPPPTTQCGPAGLAVRGAAPPGATTRCAGGRARLLPAATAGAARIAWGPPRCPLTLAASTPSPPRVGSRPVPGCMRAVGPPARQATKGGVSSPSKAARVGAWDGVWWGAGSIPAMSMEVCVCGGGGLGQGGERDRGQLQLQSWDAGNGTDAKHDAGAGARCSPSARISTCCSRCSLGHVGAPALVT